MRRERCCHYCGQALPESRMGARLTPIEGHLFDVVLQAGEAGVSNDDLYEIVMSAREADRHTMNVHIYNINEKLSETGYQIVGRTVRRLMKSGKKYHESDAITPEQARSLGL